MLRSFLREPQDERDEWAGGRRRLAAVVLPLALRYGSMSGKGRERRAHAARVQSYRASTCVTSYVDLVAAWLDLWVETARREAFYSIYLAIVGVWFMWSGLRGLVWGETRGFGWDVAPAMGQAAVRNGAVWLGLGIALLSAAIMFKVT